MRELGGRGGLAGAVHADDGNDGGLAGCLAQPGRLDRETVLDFALGNGEHIEAGGALRFVGFLHHRDNLRRHFHAEVGADERDFDFLQRGGVELGRTGDDALDLVRELVVRLGERGFEFGEKTHE
jgi:hypothetical protein